MKGGILEKTQNPPVFSSTFLNRISYPVIGPDVRPYDSEYRFDRLLSTSLIGNGSLILTVL